MIHEYYVNFCDSGVCMNEENQCTYPIQKKAKIENPFNTIIKNKDEVHRAFVEIDCVDKFRVTPPSTDNYWWIHLLIDNKDFGSWKAPFTTYVETITINFSESEIQKLLSLLTIDSEITCELYSNTEITCPYGLTFVIYEGE